MPFDQESGRWIQSDVHPNETAQPATNDFWYREASTIPASGVAFFEHHGHQVGKWRYSAGTGNIRPGWLGVCNRCNRRCIVYASGLVGIMGAEHCSG